MTVRCEHCGTKNRVPGAAGGKPVCGNCHRPLPWIADAGDEDFTEVAERSSVPVLVDLWAAWCAPCRTVSPVLERIAHEMAGRLKLVKTDIDRAPRIRERFAVRAVPTLLLMRDGKVIDRRAGAAHAGPLRTWVEEALGRDT
ncbi:thioredoxin family protein [Actinomadura livida]|uniref:Thioredoxin 2 n=1 Tax=Actinomadura livida TaxID=79909 RepID=A0A7W7IB08_9ACTN|nr:MULTISPECIES: thioredoxin domain-containing protein [Actinomadura]MBB4773792.1 thioredoxin 2 [Actinomadura catellatispora]GGU10753.1 thiol reductase thioredoxin [Actinomadura livida]